ncbi:MAG: hypothetical protein JRD89_19015 [Deltaproteobacteria bacterium]|nr:hypothetical protein [Deltaproteobacteria bacterium]
MSAALLIAELEDLGQKCGMTWAIHYYPSLDCPYHLRINLDHKHKFLRKVEAGTFENVARAAVDWMRSQIKETAP